MGGHHVTVPEPHIGHEPLVPFDEPSFNQTRPLDGSNMLGGFRLIHLHLL
jgi:hypothetical protein